MRKSQIRFGVILLASFLSIAATTFLMSLPWKHPVSAPQPEHQPRLISWNARWAPIFFRAIDKHTEEAGLSKLRTVLLPDGDVEVRVWVGDFGHYGQDGFVLRRAAGQWDALHLYGLTAVPPFSKSQRKLAAPQSGWENAWRRLTLTRILTLPNAEAVRCYAGVTDGGGYVVEININKTYRAYWYSNPEYAVCAEARYMTAIGRIIAEEFGAEIFGVDDVPPEKRGF